MRVNDVINQIVCIGSRILECLATGIINRVIQHHSQIKDGLLPCGYIKSPHSTSRYHQILRRSGNHRCPCNQAGSRYCCDADIAQINTRNRGKIFQNLDIVQTCRLWRSGYGNAISKRLANDRCHLRGWPILFRQRYRCCDINRCSDGCRRTVTLAPGD